MSETKITEEEYFRRLRDWIGRFQNGMWRYCNEPLFNRVAKSVAADVDLLYIIEDLMNVIETLTKVSERLRWDGSRIDVAEKKTE